LEKLARDKLSSLLRIFVNITLAPERTFILGQLIMFHGLLPAELQASQEAQVQQGSASGGQAGAERGLRQHPQARLHQGGPPGPWRGLPARLRAKVPPGGPPGVETSS